MWLHFLGGRKEAMSEYLLRLAAAGFRGGPAHPARQRRAFRDASAALAPDAAARVRIREHPGLDHVGAARDPGVQSAALAWLTAP